MLFFFRSFCIWRLRSSWDSVWIFWISCGDRERDVGFVSSCMSVYIGFGEM